MKTILVLLSLSLCFPVWAARDVNPLLIDHTWINVLDEVDVEIASQCPSIKNFIKELACRDAVRISFERAGDYRGTEQYINKRYKNLDRKGLALLLKEYKSLSEQARDNVDLPASFLPTFERGELSKLILRKESRALDVLLKDKSPKPCVISLEDYYASIANPDIIKCGK